MHTYKLHSKLVSMLRGEQGQFIERVLSRSGKNCDALGALVGVTGHTVRDWRKERARISLVAMRLFSKTAGVPVPKQIRIYDRYAHTRAAGMLGGQAMIAKYGRVGGDEEKRKVAWRSWWQEKGRHEESKILFKRKKISYPRKSARLAEFVGILMGDGGISARQVVVTLHSETDKEFGQYYASLCESLFGIRPSANKIKRWKAVNFVISRTELVDYCHKLGLPIGDKINNRLDIPAWIQENPIYARFCLRGLIDTDGSVFDHRYTVGGKQYSYKKLDFCTLSKPLLASAYKVFLANGMRPYIAQGKKLRLESQKDVKRYFEIIGTLNPKHLKRYAH